MSTKLNIPPVRPPMVSRPRLTERLQEGLKRNLILVSAPAGFGKTTLTSEWVRQNQPKISTAWVSLDEGDNDPVRFWDYFIAALQTIQPSVGESALALLRYPESPPIVSVLTTLINELAIVSSEYMLVLDDYHLIESQQIHDGITYLLEHMPVQMHLAIATRADPPLPLAHFRGRGTMLEIGADDLRFTLEDATSLLREMETPELSTEDVAALNERTEGWVVGLKMAALSLSGQKDIPGFIATFTGSQRYVMDYLMEEVLQKQSVEIRDFLMKTSVLERLSGPLCDAVTGREDSQGILLSLERGHLFIVPLDESRQWYRYEHLFADILRHQLEETYREEDITGLHRRAGQWYEVNNILDDAIHHTLAAQDWEEAARLINEDSKKKQGGASFVTRLNWLQQLPENVISSQPELCILYCITLTMNDKFEDAKAILKTLEKTAHGDDRIMGTVFALQAGIIGRLGDKLLAEDLAKKALSLLLHDELNHRGVMCGILGGVYSDRGNLKEAESMYTEAYEVFLQDENYIAASGPFGGLMQILWRKGRLHQTAEMCLKYVESVGRLHATIAHAILSMIFFEWNDLEAAENHIQPVIELSQTTVIQQLQVPHRMLAFIRLIQGDESGFLKALEKADIEADNQSYSPPFQAEHAAYHILFALRQDDLVTAEKWSSKLAEYSDNLSYYLDLIPSRLLIVQGKKSEAAEKLQVIYDIAVQSEAQRIMIICRVYQALTADNEESTMEFLFEALTMAEPEGYIRTFVDEGKLLKPLLEKALSKGVTPKYTRKLLTIIEAEERQKRSMKKVEGAPSTYQSLLSERELEVLRLMEEGLSNQQIADRLIISLSTTKNHVHNILEKLYVQGRT